MSQTAKLDLQGDAMAHPSRTRMLCTLMDGRAFTNKELAAAAGISPQTASAHLARLAHAGLVTALRSGRHTYHRITGEPVAEALEAMANLAPPPPVRAAKGLRHARSCYNHLAGHLAVAITDALLARGLLCEQEGRFVAAPSPLWPALGVTLPQPPGKAAFARPCLDWTERRPHIAGPMGTAMLAHAEAGGWLVRHHRGDRGLCLSPTGRAAYAALLDLDIGDLTPP